MKERVTGAEALMRALRAEGVKTVFGYPGGAIMPVYDRLYDYALGEDACFMHVLARHEQAATHAAQGYARASGEVGVAIVTSGPGATNTLTGVADAMMDSTPIVLVAGQVGVETLGTDAFQEVDLVGVAQPISKWSYQIRRAEDVAWAVARAFYIARSGRPGPVVLDFPRNAQVEEVDYEPVKVDFVRGYVAYPEIDHDAVLRAAGLINSAERPLALVGHGVELGNAYNELLEFLEKADMPAARTMLGLSALPTGHRLNMGMLGMHGNYAPNMKQRECDVLVAIGMRFSDRVIGKASQYATQARVIHLDVDPSEIDKNVPADVPVVGDCKVSLAAITRHLRKGDHRAWRESFVPLQREEFQRVIAPATSPGDGPLLMGEVVSAVSAAARGEAILVTDVGQNQMFACRYFRCDRRRSVISSGGLGTMGFGLPAAIGATFASDRTVCMFSGDGGIQMNIQELGTVMEWQVPVKIILMNNSYLGNVRQWQDMFYSGRRSFTRMLNPDYGKICDAYGIPYSLVASREALPGEVDRMLSTPGPYFMECAVKEDDDIRPMASPGTPVHGMQLELEY